MQIHELNTKALTDPAYVAFDDGTDTYKVDFNQIIDDAVAEAFSSADVSGGVVNYTSGDSSSPSSWTDVSVMASGGTLATLMNRISTMVKNVRYLWSLIGSSSISNVSSTITEAIGNTSITGIDDGTLTGAIEKHENDIDTLNGKFSYQDATVTTGTTTYDGSRAYANFTIPTDKGTLIGMYIYSVQENLGAYAIRIDDSTGRVYTHATSKTVTIRMLFMA